MKGYDLKMSMPEEKKKELQAYLKYLKEPEDL